MNTHLINIKINRWKLFAACLAGTLALLISGPAALAHDDPLKGLAGPAFSNPSDIQEMPEEWTKQPVKHDKAAGNADLIVNLDQHMYKPLLPAIQKYAREHNLKIEVMEGTCGIASGMLQKKTIEIGGFCCPPGKTDRLPGLQYHTIGIVALALLVHPDNPVDNVSAEEARKLFTGEIYRWSDIRNAAGKKWDLTVHPVVRPHCKLRPGHWRRLLDNEDLFSPKVLEVGAIPDMISQVAAEREAIGNEVLWNLVRYKDKGKVKPISIGGYSPLNEAHLLSGKYPLYEVYSLTTWQGKGPENREASKLVEYLLQHTGDIDPSYEIIPASRLKKAGWKFKGNELIGEPE